MPDPGMSVPRKSAFSCEACRKRKVKCSGTSPACERCQQRGEECVYNLAPSLAYTKSLEARVSELETALARGTNTREHSVEGKSIASRTTSPVSNQASRVTEDGSLAHDIEGLRIEDDGRISFHGPTSLFQLPSGLAREQTSAFHSPPGLDRRRERLITNAWRERAFEQYTTIQEPFRYLLDSHWCWIQPLFNFVYRPAFTRDMKMKGPYYSDFLMSAIVSHSVRWCKNEPRIGQLLDDHGPYFFNQAVEGVFNSVRDGHCSIPIIQSLLLLSAHECGRGNRTQAWLYSGMAFRLVEDMGISIDCQKYPGWAQFSDEDVEIRNRLFWSCYFWDKLVSLYFGRSPIIQDTPVSPPRLLLDDTAECEIWTPHGVVFPEGTQYPQTPAHSTSCFVKMCSLSEILNQIIIHMYDPIRRSTEQQFVQCAAEQTHNLQQWWDELPSFLKLSVGNLPSYCPPSHIVTLNCLYHTTNILLHRPTLCSRQRAPQLDQNPRPLLQCVSSANSVIALYDLYRRTFGDTHVVLSLAYSLYTASSIFVLQIQALREASAATVDPLRYCVLALERVKASNPVIHTAISLITSELAKLNIDIHDPISPAHPQPIPSPSFPPSFHPTAFFPPNLGGHPGQPFGVGRYEFSPAGTGTGARVGTRPGTGTLSYTPSPTTDPFSDSNASASASIVGGPGTGAGPGTATAAAAPDGLDPSILISADLIKPELMVAPELFEAFSYPYVDPLGSGASAGVPGPVQEPAIQAQAQAQAQAQVQAQAQADEGIEAGWSGAAP